MSRWQRLVPVSVVVLALGFGCSTSASNDAPATGNEPPASAASGTPIPTDVSSTVEAASTRIAWSAAGAALVSPDGGSVQITEDPIANAVYFAAGQLAYQVADGAVHVRAASGEEFEIPADASRSLDLLAGGIIDDRPVLVLLSSERQPSEPALTEDQVLLFDIGSQTITTLATFPGWERSVVEAQVGSSGIALLEAQGVSNSLRVLNLDGSTRHEIPLASDASLASAIRPSGTEVAVLQPLVDLSAEQQLLRVHVFDLDTGTELSSEDARLQPFGIDLDAGFCLQAVYEPDGSLTCDQSSGPPLRLDPTADWRTEAVDYLSEGMTAPAL